MKKKKIAVVIVGASHRDPAPINILKKYLMLLNQRSVSLVSCAEVPCDQSLQVKHDLDLLNIQIYKKILTDTKAVSSLLHKDAEHSKPYFLADQILEVTDALKPTLANLCGPDLSDGQAKNIAQQLMNYLAIDETIQFDQYLKMHKILYQGLERVTHQHQQFTQVSWNNSSFFQNSEHQRIGHMTDKICQDAFGKLAEEGGIIFCQVGTLHAQRLAASILNRVATQSVIDVKVVPMCCYSKYSVDAIMPYLGIIRQEQGKDPAHLQQLYQTFATPLVEILENVAECKFSSKGFDQMMDIAIQHVNPNISYIAQDLRGDTAAFLVQNDIGFKPDRSCCPTSCVIL